MSVNPYTLTTSVHKSQKDGFILGGKYIISYIAFESKPFKAIAVYKNDSFASSHFELNYLSHYLNNYKKYNICRLIKIIELNLTK